MFFSDNLIAILADIGRSRMRMIIVPFARSAGTFIAAIFEFFPRFFAAYQKIEMADGTGLEQKVKKYEEFVNDKLRKDLETVMKTQEEVNSKISEYLQLKSIIESIKNCDGGAWKGLKTQVDLGCNFYCQAQVTDPTKILVSVGYGFFVEFTLDEALTFIEKKCNQLATYSSKLGNDSSKIKAHIKLVLEGLRELQDIGAKKDEPRPVW